MVRVRAMLRDFTKALLDVWRASGEPCSAYRPDLHYMRGPGPKWHAKYDSLCQKTSTNRSSAAPVLREAAEHRA
jgi:hypothetical protein